MSLRLIVAKASCYATAKMARGQDVSVNGLTSILVEPSAEIRSLSLAQNGYAERSNLMNALFGAGS